MTDDDPSRYTTVELARKDQNYRIDDIDAVARFVIESFEASRA